MKVGEEFSQNPAAETRGIQNVLDSLPAQRARGARAEDFMDPSLMEERRFHRWAV
ncbi:MAG TPA: hypothetical protein VE689_08940 [Candidatus Udaeobacter sp.]|jgi:hypothetical protein|nr:hypothetical protein [Candidatus Udaeobacter sp.]